MRLLVVGVRFSGRRWRNAKSGPSGVEEPLFAWVGGMGIWFRE
jgi:hypothetical protein